MSLHDKTTLAILTLPGWLLAIFWQLCRLLVP